MQNVDKPGQAGATTSASFELSDAEVEAGARAVSEWRSLGGFEHLGTYDLVRRIAVAVQEAGRSKG